MTPPTLEEAFGERPNAFHALRLLFAVLVVVWHAWWLTTPMTALIAPARQLLEELPVDAFFAISGLLITRAWLRRSDTGSFLIARGLRILPGLWVCLIVTAFVLVPIGGGAPALRAQLEYVVHNAALVVLRPTVGEADTFVANVSLWTLGWEVGCYLAVVALGLARLLRPRIVTTIGFALWLFALLLAPLGDLPGRAWFDALPRLGLMFCCGSLLWLHRDAIPVRGSLASLSAVVVALGSLLPDYRLVAAPALAYLVVWAGLALGRWRLLRLRHDVSYGVYVYGFPIQMALMTAGGVSGWLPLTALTLVVALPVATASWLLVERPAMGLRVALAGRSARPDESAAECSPPVQGAGAVPYVRRS